MSVASSSHVITVDVMFCQVWSGHDIRFVSVLSRRNIVGVLRLSAMLPPCFVEYIAYFVIINMAVL